MRFSRSGSERPSSSSTACSANAAEKRGPEPTATHGGLTVATMVQMVWVSVSRGAAMDAGHLLAPHDRRRVLTMLTGRRVLVCAQAVQILDLHRLSTIPRLGTLSMIAGNAAVWREAAGAAVCGAEALRGFHPVELPVVLLPGMALFGSTGGCQRPIRPPTGLEGSLLVPWVGMGPKLATVEAFREHNRISETSLASRRRTQPSPIH